LFEKTCATASKKPLFHAAAVQMRAEMDRGEFSISGASFAICGAAIAQQARERRPLSVRARRRNASTNGSRSRRPIRTTAVITVAPIDAAWIVNLARQTRLARAAASPLNSTAWPLARPRAPPELTASSSSNRAPDQTSA